MLKKIISGGQAGVEIAALDTAIKLNIPHEGWTFQRKGTESGIWPECHNLKTMDQPSYQERLEKNIIDSEGTVVLTLGQLVMGLKMVKDLANKHQKPCLRLDLTNCSLIHAITSIRKWIANNEIETIYFTGSKPVGDSNIYEETIRIIEGIIHVEREQDRLPGFNP